MEGFFIAQVIMFAGNFAPQGWAFCQGQLLSIDDNTALFALVGTTYGGDGQNTFGLPDFRGRIPVGVGTGPGLSNIVLGEQSGAPTRTLLSSNLPQHTHAASAAVAVSSVNATQTSPNGNIIATPATNFFVAPALANDNMGGVTATIQPAGGSQPVPVSMPYLGMNFVIALYGIFPSRN